MSDSCVSEALGAYHAGDPDRAVALLEAAIAQDPTAALYRYHLGNIHWGQGRASEAAGCFAEARDLDPEVGDVPYRSGVECARAGMLTEAEQCLWLALGFRPRHSPTLTCLGDVLRRQGRVTEALQPLTEAVRVAPDSTRAHVNLGIALCEMDRLEDAAAVLESARRLTPDDAEAANNLAMVYKQQGRVDEALRLLDEAVMIAPDFAEARLNRAMTLLLKGDFEAGWREYEWRPKAVLPCERPLEPGMALDGKTVLLHQEQGLGDLIQFVRYAEPLQRMGARVVVECDKPVAPLIRTALGVDGVVCPGAPLPDFDFNMRLLSLPRVLGWSTRVSVPYLQADAARVAFWRDRLSGETRPRVGIIWGGTPGSAYDRRRSIPLTSLKPLLDQGVAAYSLQRGPRAAELGQQPQIVDLEAECAGIMDTAAAMMSLDLIISADTMPAHLAGALGRPVWVLLPFAPDWRWQLSRDDTPWYPAMRLYRQSRPGDWEGVIRRVASELRAVR